MKTYFKGIRILVIELTLYNNNVIGVQYFCNGRKVNSGSRTENGVTELVCPRVKVPVKELNESLRLRRPTREFIYKNVGLMRCFG